MIKILNVDDNQDYHALVRGLLRRRFQADVITASSADEAIEIIAKADRLDFVICDYSMPGGDGIKVFNYMKETGKTYPFLLFTNVADSSLIRFDGPNFLGILSKTDFNQLCSRIANYLDLK